MGRILHTHVIVLLASGLLGAGALAQELEGVTFQAQPSRVDVTDAGYTPRGPFTSLSLSHRVSLANLDLATSEGMSRAESRVREAALHGCIEISLTNPNAEPSDWNCARLATKKTMAQIRELVAGN